MKKLLSSTMIAVIALSVLSLFVNTSETQIGSRSRRIIVDNSGNDADLSNFQVFLNITYDSDMQDDFDDLRFTWFNDTTEQEVNINYWVDKYVESEYALVWVKIPSIRALGQETLYMYYGDPNAASESNGEQTFVFFDGFSTDTTANYQLWSPGLGTANPNEYSWDPNGWLFVNASIRESAGRCSNLHVYHKTAVMDPTEEKYWLDTRCRSFGDGWLDYLGASNTYKRDSTPQDGNFLVARVYQGIRDVYPMNRSNIDGRWAGPEWGVVHDLPTNVKDQWFRIGLGTAPNGTVVGSFCDDNYRELDTLVGHTTHQDAEWWIDLVISRVLTDTWATLCAHFDYVRVRKFTDPEPSYSIGLEEPIPATVNIDPDTLNLKSNGQWITVYITLPQGYDVENIVLSTVSLNEIPADWSEIQNEAYMVKFDRATVQTSLTNEPDYESAPKFYYITLTITGELANGRLFEGSDTNRVIKK